MKSMKHMLVLVSIASATAFSGSAFAQTTMDSSKMGDMKTMANSHMTQGEVRKIDKDTKKITIRHGEIKNLEMPPMTMVSQVRDSALLEGSRSVKRCSSQSEGQGRLRVTHLQTAK